MTKPMNHEPVVALPVLAAAIERELARLFEGSVTFEASAPSESGSFGWAIRAVNRPSVKTADLTRLVGRVLSSFVDPLEEPDEIIEQRETNLRHERAFERWEMESAEQVVKVRISEEM